MVIDNSDLMDENIRMIEKLDLCFLGKLSLKLNAVMPKINTERIIKLKDGRHP